MTIYHQKAIELKYAGKTYREISKAINLKISEGVLQKYFMTDGMLYIPYLQYEARMNDFNEKTARSTYKKMTGWTARVQQQLLKLAINRGDYRLAWDIIKDINDRAGLVVVRKSEVNVDDRATKEVDTYDKFTAELRRLGIDPGTGLRMAETKVEEAQVLQA